MSYKIFTDSRGGDLIPVEFGGLPFEPKRVFSVSNVPQGQRRGCHAHFETRQVLICVNGSILVGLHDGKTLKETILKKGDSILVDKLVWDYQDFLTGNDFMISICSTEYNKTDYIEDFEYFLQITS